MTLTTALGSLIRHDFVKTLPQFAQRTPLLRDPFAQVPPFVRAFQMRSFSSQSLQNRCLILSIDGGGIRGIIPGKILEEIERKTKRPIARSFDMIAGTSTGGILGLGLSLPGEEKSTPRYTASQVLAFYLEKKSRDQIFQKTESEGSILPRSKPAQHPIALSNSQRPNVPIASIEFDGTTFSGGLLGGKVIEVKAKGEYFEVDTNALKVLVPKKSMKDPKTYQFHSDYETIRQWVQPKFSAMGIEAVLKQRFGSTRLSELLPQEVFVATFNTSKMRHSLWSKALAKTGGCSNVMAWEAARASSAAPTYFPAFNIEGNEYIDGGVCMNNPALTAISQALKSGIPIEKIVCVSLGTGQFTKPLAPTTHFGALRWAANIFEATSCGISSQTDECMRTLLGKKQYIRIQVDLPENIELDRSDDTAIEDLEKVAKRAILENRRKLERIYQLIEKQRS